MGLLGDDIVGFVPPLVVTKADVGLVGVAADSVKLGFEWIKSRTTRVRPDKRRMFKEHFASTRR
jgi:hypothetical protein